jgi:hypothetical protein
MPAPLPTPPSGSAPPLAAAFRITPDQFQPLGGTATDRSAAPPAAPVAAPSPLPSPSTVARAPPPLEPAARDAGSPLVDRSHLPPPPPPSPERTPLAAPPPPERIVERLRVVPVAPAAPPRAMTAAGQSVIGALGERRSGGWQPRQEGF